MAPKQKLAMAGAQLPAKRIKKSQSEHVVAEALTTEQEEDLSSALIAKLLAEENAGDYGFENGIGGMVGSVADGYYAEYNNEMALKSVMNSKDDAYMESEEEQDDDYEPGRKTLKEKKKIPLKMTAQKKKKQVVDATSTDIPAQSIECSPEQNDAAGKPSEQLLGAITTPKPPKAKVSKRKERATDDGLNTGVYTEDEEKRFLEGLELYGRAWQDLADQMNLKRDTNSIRSHAQKHFIKLFRDNCTLPAKVTETGYGYTLSGKPLDPDSAAAKPYLSMVSYEGPEVSNPLALELNRRGTNGVTGVLKKGGRKQKTGALAPGLPVTAAADENAALAATGNETTSTSPTAMLPMPLVAEATQEVSPEARSAPDNQSVQTNSSPDENGGKVTLANNPSSGTVHAGVASTTVPEPSLISLQATPSVVENPPQVTFEPPKSEFGNAGVMDSPSSSLTVPENPTANQTNTAPPAAATTEDRSATDEVNALSDGPLQTDYSKNRPRRAKTVTAVNYQHMTGEVDPLSMVKCESFAALPNSGLPGAQPFAIEVNSNVLLFMDLHAHLMTVEIIGFLAGKWDPISKRLEILSVFPCRSLPTGQDHVNVEMDPTSECEVRARIREKDLQVVGWYHSHPTFAPDPSLVDLENQTNYQRLFRDEKGVEAFVGVIVGPYDPRLPGSSSVVNWFYVPTNASERGTPKRTVYELKKDEGVQKEEYEMMLDLIETYRNAPERAAMSESWRPGDSQTRLEKLCLSLAGRVIIDEPCNVPDDGPAEEKEAIVSTPITRPNFAEGQMSGTEFVRKIRDALSTW